MTNQAFSAVGAGAGYRSTPKKAAVASLVGSALEWYDFFLYGTAAALIIGPLFFPSSDSVTGTLEAFVTFAVGFAARPIGGLIFGHFGDRLGRKKMLVITLMMMGISTALIGALPTHAQAGVIAPILLVLVRIVQGMAVGGEWGGSVLLIAEHSPHRRGFFTSFSQVGIMLGFVLSAGMFALFNQLPHHAFMSWGWRVPFLVSILLTVGGLAIRMKIEETPEFKVLQAGGQTHRYPVVEALRTQPKQIAITIGARMAENGGSYIFLVFAIAYGKHVGMDATTLLIAAIVGNLVEMATVVLWGSLSDTLGRRPIYLIGAIGVVVWAFPFFALIQTGETLNLYIALLVALGVCHGAMIGSQPTMFAELFRKDVRYSGMAIGHEVAAVIAGGIAPLIATALLAKYDTYWPIAIYLAILGLITVTAVAVAPETLSARRHGQQTDDDLAKTSQAVGIDS
ncbi:MFS transporter [Leekyejoonella antrihumi]|uniref:Putative proline/betaine transporter n=1 Tax=Leekyejoonella antrihumi TaxID=1660198 RepID=A0A563DS13_9MICO|nr:MFS transporter [Leekyejoonella antrihumi]TWP32966.1 MHS family MFS transporter [Leekyejoonella antrihumi]